MSAHAVGSWQNLANCRYLDLDNLFLDATKTKVNISGITLDFSTWRLDTGQKVRRLSTKEHPDKVFQWECDDDVSGVSLNTSWWDDYDTDCCEVLRMAQECGRTTVVLYLGPDFTTYEVNLATKLQTNKLSGTQRFIREAPHESLSAVGAGGAQTVHEAAQLVVSSARRVLVFAADDSCAICLEAFDAQGSPDGRGYQLSECGPHYFHAECIHKQLVRNGKCAVCSKHYIVNTGNQPAGSTMTVQTFAPGSGYSLAGYPVDVGVIVIMYSVPSGIQGPEHPHPGVHYSGTYRHAFLPDNPEGREVLQLLRICFDRRLTFTVGRSLTTGCDNVVTWNGVHHKTSTHGGPAYFGFPDDSYFFRVKLELKAKGIGLDLV